MNLTKETLEQIRFASKVVTLNYDKIVTGGFTAMVASLYPGAEPEVPADEEEARLLEEKIEKIRKHFAGNEYGCQEDRTRIIIGLAVAGDEKLFVKGTTRSTEASFEAGKAEYPFLILLPKNNESASSYPVGRPMMCLGKDRLAIKRDGQRGNVFYVRDTESVKSTFNAQQQDVATEAQIDQYFDNIITLAESVSNPEEVDVHADFPLLTGELGRSLRTIYDEHKVYSAVDAILNPAPVKEV